MVECQFSLASVALGAALEERMLIDESVRVGVGTLDVGLELADLDPPLPAAADLHGLEVLAADEGIDLRAGDVEDLRHVGQLQEARGSFHAGHCATRRISLRPGVAGCLWKGRFSR